jgi:cellulose synthase/poly-beta-1,6-N-acetylglucosamine synthase-like glycosyltransferase
MFVAIVVIEVLRLVQNATMWLCAWTARDPVPYLPQHGLRVAMVTTIVPSKEPVALVAETLWAMLGVAHDGPVDVWILDEGDDPTVRRIATQLGVRHFSRKGVPAWNQPSGEFRARSKHGNHNAWRAAHAHRYDVVAVVDPDHVPLPSFLRRTLGYFHDPDVAFVVSPQVYGNQDGFLTRAAESQAFVFQGVVQRAGNAANAAMFVGTNHLYRVHAWKQIGGYQDSITEDLLTSMVVHASRNPGTGARWKGVYTPDVLAVGEGPSSWTDYFNQQKRWSWGVWEIVLRHGHRLVPKLGLRQRLHYALMELFYPSIGVVWILGNTLTGLYMFLGSTGIVASIPLWGALWVDTAAAQLALFLWLRRFDVSPFKEPGSSGFRGIALSVMAGPVYVGSTVGALLRRPLQFVVTAKGNLTSPDSWRTFRGHLLWLAFTAAALGASFVLGHAHVILRLWAAATILTSLVPVLAWRWRRKRPAAPGHILRAPAVPAFDVMEERVG